MRCWVSLTLIELCESHSERCWAPAAPPKINENSSCSALLKRITGSEGGGPGEKKTLWSSFHRQYPKISSLLLKKQKALEPQKNPKVDLDLRDLPEAPCLHIGYRITCPTLLAQSHWCWVPSAWILCRIWGVGGSHCLQPTSFVDPRQQRYPTVGIQESSTTESGFGTMRLRYLGAYRCR